MSGNATAMALAIRIAFVAGALGTGLIAGFPGVAAAQMPDLMDDDVRAMLAIDELEWSGPSGSVVWRADAWVGNDLHKFRVRTDGANDSGGVSGRDLELLYSRALRPFWDLQLGVRHDVRPGGADDWAVAGVQGLAPYWFEVEASLAIADGGQRRVHARASYELLLTQRLILEPEAEVTFFAHDEPDRLIGRSLSEAEFGIRLRYEIRREFAPYVGLVRHSVIGSTGDMFAARGFDRRDTELVIGIRAWY